MHTALFVLSLAIYTIAEIFMGGQLLSNLHSNSSEVFKVTTSCHITSHLLNQGPLMTQSHNGLWYNWELIILAYQEIKFLLFNLR